MGLGNSGSATSFEDLAARFREIVTLVASNDPLREVVVLVDSVQPLALNPLASQTWDSVVSMLILAFPEIRWVFGATIGSCENPAWEDAARCHSLANLFTSNATSLFDGSGLREWIRGRAKKTAPYLPHRRLVAAALDEETAYAEFHAYVAYRFGFRAFALTSDAVARHLAGDTGSHFALTFEDIYLNFPDKFENESYSSLANRAKWYPRLDCARRRYFITVGHHFGQGADGRYSLENQAAFRKLREERRGGRVLNKPVAGIHGIWSETGLSSQLEWFDPNDQGRRRVAVGEGYVWPPMRPREGEPIAPGGHSAPGRLLQVAEHLIHRAEKLVGEVKNTQDAVRGAVIATDALELIGCRTPTLARDALELRHRFEVLAECQFGGVEYNLDLRPRFAEIRRDVEAIGDWFGPDHKRLSAMNGELSIISRLATILRSYNEYDEEDSCLGRGREIQRGIWLKRQMPWSLVIWPFRFYVEWLLSSPRLLLGVTMLWILMMMSVVHFKFGLNGIQTVTYVIGAFFGGQPMGDKGWWVALITSVAVITGFLHLGIFISRLYGLIARK